MMISDLSADLEGEILSRVPAISLKRLRSSCKRWNALFKDRRFTEEHFRNATKQSLVVMLKEYRICSVSVNLNVSPPSVKFKGALSLKDFHSRSKQVCLTQVFHCNGLLLCTTTKDNRLVVWNLCLRETRWIQHKPAYKSGSMFALGYLNNTSCPSYKILRYWVNFDPGDPIVELEIYEFSSNTWRVLNNVFDCFIHRNGVSLKGNSYWLASDGASEKFLICFDFTTEIFRRLCLPPSHNCGYTALSVVREEQLSVLHENIITSKRYG